MPERLPQQEDSVVFRFGGGLHTAAPEDEIGPREAAAGRNFTLDVEKRELRNRKPFDLIGTVPNAAEIRGFACLFKADETVSFLVQAGNKVYEWNGITIFTEKATVSATAKLRGNWRTNNWQLTDRVIITDIALVDPVKEWDGTTFANVAFTDEVGSAFGIFKARYALIGDNERVIFANVNDGTSLPHLAVSTALGSHTQITVKNRPSSAASAADPWFLPIPDNRYINGLAQAFGVLVFSTRKGNTYKLTGSDSTDFKIDSFYLGSGAAGDEALVNVGNDIHYGRAGRIESLISTDRFGDVETDDLTLPISNQMESFDDWLLIYNQRNQRIYCHPIGQSRLYVLHKPMLDVRDISPWTDWRTANAVAFNPTAMMNMLDPLDGLEYVFFGDGSGNMYRLEGTGTAGDGGTHEINTTFTSHTVRAQLDGFIFDVEGWITYRRPTTDISVTLTFLYSGKNVFDRSITLTLQGLTPTFVWGVGGGAFWGVGGGAFWGSQFSQRLKRQDFGVPSQETEFQCQVGVVDNVDFEILEVGVRFTTAV